MPEPKHGAPAPTAPDASTPVDRIYKAVIHVLSCYLF
jgi:hypothetical protein